MKPDVLLVHPGNSTFVERDLLLLREKYSVNTLEYDKRRTIAPLLAKMARCRLAFAWFALGYAYPMVQISLFRGIPIVMVAGGYDVEAIPELDYGMMINPVRRRRTSFALAKSNRVLAVSNFTKSRVMHWSSAARADVVYHGFPRSEFDPTMEREHSVLTVANIRRGTWKLKGLETYVEVARRIPEASFQIVGKVEEDPGTFARSIPSNVHLRGWLPYGQLYKLYTRSKVYAQLSFVESFGCALAEAMSCGCHPVVTDRGALPEVVGNVSSPVPYGDVGEAEQAIREGLTSRGSRQAHQRIAETFPIHERRRRLHAIVDELLVQG